MKQKSKLKDLIEDIVDSDLLTLDESEYQSQEESRDEDEDDLEEDEDEDEVEEARRHAEDEDEIEESEDEDEDEESEDEDEESEDEEKLEEGSMDSLSLSDLWNKHRSYVYTADQGYGIGHGSMEGSDKAANAIYKFVSTKYGKKTADDMQRASDYHLTYAEYAGPGDSDEAEAAEEKLRKKYNIKESEDEDEDKKKMSEAEDEEGEKEVEEQYENIKIDLSNVTNLIESETGLTEEFKSKAAIIFEAEVKSQLRTIREGLKKTYSRRLEEAVSFVEDKLTEQIDGYLTYAVQQWMKENQVAIESSLRTEIAENFMGSLKTLFTESYVEVPASKLDLYSKLEEEKQEVESKLGRSLELLGGLVEKVEDLSREKAIEEACEGLTQTQAVRLKKLAESVEFSDESSFKDKVQTLKEFYFADKGLKNKTKKTLTEEFSNYEDSEIETIVEGQILSTTKLDPEMSQYLKALNAMNKSVTY